MDGRQFFLQQYDYVRHLVDDMVVGPLDDEQLKRPSEAGLNSLAWYLWHTARWQDFSMRVVAEDGRQVLDESWQARLHIPRWDLGTGMTADECASLNAAIQVEGLRAYWKAIGDRVRAVAGGVLPERLDELVDELRLREALADRAIASERARWLESFLDAKTVAWWLSFVVWHMAEHLLGGAVCVRRLKGVPLGL